MSGNTRKANFLASIPVASIDASEDTITTRCKFNFSYFDKQDAGQAFDEWPDGQLAKLFDKLRDYSKESLTHWTKEAVGKSGSVLAIYGGFPQRSDFTLPKHVPHQARWGRFRLEQAVRLVGFVLPDDYRDKIHSSGVAFDCNTFYVVFLDANHVFYKSEAR